VGVAIPVGATGRVTDRGTALSRIVAVAWLGVLFTASLATAQQKLKVEVSNEGFKPKVVNLRRGETIRLVLTTADEEHCFAVDALRIEKRIVPGKATEVDLSVEKAGSLPFYCCLEPSREVLHGRIVVTE
jgi:heme/copper-type cytochrome/quinol oxidase subunit 2